MQIGRHADNRLDTRQSAPLGIHQRYEVDDVFDATIDAGDVSPVREGGTVAHLTGKHVVVTASEASTKTLSRKDPLPKA